MYRKIKQITIFTPVTIPNKSGAGLNAFNLAKEFVSQGYTVRIVSFRYQKLKVKSVQEGVEIIEYQFGLKRDFLKFYLMGLLYLSILSTY